MIDFVPHRAAWTPEKSARFHSQLISLTPAGEDHVHRGIGNSMFRLARAHSADVSGELLEIGRQSNRVGGASFAEVTAPLASDRYSAAFVVDTVEHLVDEELRLLIAELHRALRPGGSLVIVAPNDEKLRIGETVCPDCGCMFHRLNHVRSWTAGTLAAFLSECGFETVAAMPWYLDESWWKSWLITRVARTLGKRSPHLIYVGRKRVSR